jgi:uroporphyrinogen-III synthase
MGEGSLEGRVVVVTRDEGEDGPLAALLREAGARVVHLPTVRHLPPAYAGPLRQAAACANEFSWIVFTSARAVAPFARVLREEGRSFGDVGAPVACLGVSTARTLESAGGNAALLVTDAGSEGMVAALAARNGLKGATILYPHGDNASPALADGLHELGAEITGVIAYRTETAAGARDLMQAALGADAVLFCSPSSTMLLEQLAPGERLMLAETALMGSMGPATTGALGRLGITAAFEARPRTFEGLVDALAAALAKR